MTKTQINIRVAEEQKAQWEEFAEESREIQYGVSELIRKSVTQFIQTEGTPTRSRTDEEGHTTIPEDLTERLARIEDTLGDVKLTTERIDESAEFIERALTDDGEESFSDRLLRAIPPSKPQSEEWDEDRERYEESHYGKPVVWEGTSDAFAEQMDADRQLVNQSLDAIVKRVDSPVETAVVDDRQRYYAPRDLLYQPYADGREAERDVQQRKRRNRKEER